MSQKHHSHLENVPPEDENKICGQLSCCIHMPGSEYEEGTAKVYPQRTLSLAGAAALEHTATIVLLPSRLEEVALGLGTCLYIV